MGLVVDPFVDMLTVFKGATFRKAYQWLAGEDEGVMEPVSFSGCTARCHVRSRIDSPDPPLAELTTENGGILLGAQGYIQLYIAPETSAALAVKKAVFDVEIVWPDGDVCRVLGGQITLSPEVTRQ